MPPKVNEIILESMEIQEFAPSHSSFYFIRRDLDHHNDGWPTGPEHSYSYLSF